MSLTAFFRKALGFASTFVAAVRDDRLLTAAEPVLLTLRPTWRIPRCGECGRRALRPHGGAKPRQWRHLGLFGRPVVVSCMVQRILCRRCGVRTMSVPWARVGSVFTREFEDEVAWFAQRTDRTTTARHFGISWQTVGKIAQRVVAEKLDGSLLDNLEAIGIDEIYYGRPRKCLTVIVDLKTGRVVWSVEGRSARSLVGFFRALGPVRRRAIRIVSMDMSGAYQKAIRKNLRRAEIVFDRFHIVQLLNAAVDEVRRELARSIMSDPELRRSIKGSRWALLKNPWNLTTREKERLSVIARTNKRLYRAYLLKESLQFVLGQSDATKADAMFDDWYQWARRSRLDPFKKLAKTLRHLWAGVRRAIELPYTNALAEGINSKIRLISHRSFGLHSAQALQALIFLCCSGVEITPKGQGPAPQLHTL
jgi:transposase